MFKVLAFSLLRMEGSQFIFFFPPSLLLTCFPGKHAPIASNFSSVETCFVSIFSMYTAKDNEKTRGVVLNVFLVKELRNSTRQNLIHGMP